MRPFLLALAFAVAACASSKESGRDEVPAAASAQLPSATQKPDQDEQSPSPGNPGGAAAGGASAGPPSKPAEALQRSTEPAGPMTARTAAGSTPAGPMTAAEAAQHLSHDLQGAGGDAGRSAASAPAGKSAAGPGESKSAAGPAASQPRKPALQEGNDALSCNADADCSFTRVAAGACCPMLCEPRVVAKKHAQALEKQEATCNAGRPCPVAPCRPPRQQQTAACVEHKCTAKVSRTAIDN